MLKGKAIIETLNMAVAETQIVRGKIVNLKVEPPQITLVLQISPTDSVKDINAELHRLYESGEIEFQLSEL